MDSSLKQKKRTENNTNKQFLHVFGNDFNTKI